MKGGPFPIARVFAGMVLRPTCGYDASVTVRADAGRFLIRRIV